MTIREMTFEDIDAVEAIEQDVFGSSSEAWSATGFLTYLMREDTLFLVAEEDGVIGYAALLMVPYEADLITVCVRRDARRQGTARALLAELFRRAPEFGVTTIHLEVRAGNEAAIRLYEKEGFAKTGLRKDYYIDPREDALTMTRTEDKKC